MARRVAILDRIPLLDARPFPLTEETPWREKCVRKLTVKGFFIYYLVDETQKTVTVTAVVYGRRDQISALREIDD